MRVCLLCAFIFLMIESNEDCTEEGEDSEYQEERDQGQATQGKTSTCCISKSYMSLCIAPLLLPLLCIVFLYCYFSYVAIVGDLAPQVNLLSSPKMTPFTPTQYPEKYRFND
jgi:hypothetical protein